MTIDARTFVMVVGMVLGTAASAHAADYYVAPDGNDDAEGTMEDPWASIAHADAVVIAGDVVHVLPGEYSGTFQTDASGSEGAPIVFVSDETWSARLVAEGDGWIARGDWVEIVGFEYTGDAAVGMLAMGSHVRYLSNWVHHLNPACDGNGGAAIDAGNYDATHVDMIGNVVHDVWADDTDGTPCNRVQGLYHAIPFGTIANNLAWHNSGWGIHTWHNPSDLVITNNLVFDNGGGGIIVGAGDSPGDGYADNFLVANNIVMHNPLGIYEYGDTGLGNRYVSNLMYENGDDIVLQNGLVDEGTISADPGLVDFQLDGSGDYRPAPGSPAIDAGTPEGAPPTDIDGVARPQGEGFDIGPYELPVDVGTTGGDDTASTGDGGGDVSGDADAGTGDGGGDEAPDPVTSSAASGDTSGSSSAGSQDDAASGCGCAQREPGGGASFMLLVAALLRRRRA